MTTNFDWFKIQKLYDTGKTVRECGAIFGFSRGAWGAAVKRGNVKARKRNKPFEALQKRSAVRKRVLAQKLLPYICQLCGAKPEWMGKPLSLILDHINGVANDHRLENLRFLCPNCNSQQDTFSGRNTKLQRAKRKQAI